MRSRWDIIGLLAFVLIVAFMVFALIALSTDLNSTPSCAERGGTPTTWQHRDACLLPGGVIIQD